MPTNGEWTIRVTDNLGADNGWLFGWEIQFQEYLYPNLETFSPQLVQWGWNTNPSVIEASQNNLLASPVNAGNAAYTFWVTDEFGCQTDTTLTFEVLPQTHPNCSNCDIQINEQEDVVLCENQTQTLNAAPVAGVLNIPVTFEQFPQDAIGFANHPPANPYRSTLDVNSIRPLTITNPLAQIQSICFTISTDFTADLNVTLEAPNGAVLPLALANGGASNLGYQQTCFTPTALQSINAGAPPFTGNFQPEGNWNLLIGAPINGDWTLRITDAFGLYNSVN
ncbi:MAG: hypothetical protein R2795_14035 [Saprospiraceae bacterium]